MKIWMQFLRAIMNTINYIRNKIGCHPNGYQWPGELAQPNHLLWKFAKYLSQNPSENQLDIPALFEGILQEGSISYSDNPLFIANLNIIKGLANAEKMDQFFNSAANEYGKLLAGFDFDCPLSLGNKIVKLTVKALQPKTSQTSCFVARSFFVVTGNSLPMAIPFFVKVLPQKAKPVLLFDPIALGTINFNLGIPDKDFLRLSVLPAWQWYLAKFKEDAKSLQWGLGHPSQKEALEHPSHKESPEKKNPSPKFLSLKGPSAGGAFAMAFRSAHEEAPLDQKFAISVAIEKSLVEGGEFSFLPVGELDQKAKVGDISTILYISDS